MDASGQRGFHFSAGLKGAEDGDRVDRRQCEPGRDIGRDANKSDDLDMKFFTRGSHRLQVCPAVVSKAKLQCLPDDRLRDFVTM